MSVDSLVRAMPKLDLHVQFEGALPKDLVLMIAEQSEMVRTYKREKLYHEWVDLYREPEIERLDEIVAEAASWVRHPDDLARAVYELGVDYSHQNVRYAEIAVNPAIFTDAGLTFQQLLDGINDGADRVERAWQVRIRWIMAMPRERPRKSDDIARWAISANAQKGNVVALGLYGREAAQPIAQFQKAFATAEKKDLPRVTHALSHPETEPLARVMEMVNPQRLTDVGGLLDDEQALTKVVETAMPVLVTPSREARLGRISGVADFPFRALLDAGVNVIIGSGMPAMYESSLTDEYLAALNAGALTLEDIQTMNLHAIQASFQPDEDKQAMLEDFQQAYAALAEEHLAEETE